MYVGSVKQVRDNTCVNIKTKAREDHALTKSAINVTFNTWTFIEYRLMCANSIRIYATYAISDILYGCKNVSSCSEYGRTAVNFVIQVDR